jgi:hypothetical protein
MLFLTFPTLYLLNCNLIRYMEFQDGPFRVSDNDILISRRRVRDFLSQKTAYDLLPDSGKVLQIHSSLSLSLSLSLLSFVSSTILSICCLLLC